MDEQAFYGADGRILDATIDIEALGLAEGGLQLIRHALAGLPPGEPLRVRGRAPEWELHLSAWCRQQGHAMRSELLASGEVEAVLSPGPWAEGRWRDAAPTGRSHLEPGELPAAHAEPAWGLAARGALVEAGSPAFSFGLSRRDELWATTAGELYAQAAAAQWDPGSAIDWDTPSSCRRPSRRRWRR